MRERLEVHAGLVVSGLLIFIFAAKLMVVSSGNVTTALSVLHYASLTETLTGMLVTLVPLVAGACLAVLVLGAIRRERSEQDRLVVTLPFVLFGIVALGMVLPWWAAVGATVVYALLSPTLRRQRERSHPSQTGTKDSRLKQWFSRNVGADVGDDETRRRVLRRNLNWLVALGLLLVVTVASWGLSALWLPAVQYRMRDNRMVVGYELSRTENDIIVLRDSDRTVLQLPRKQVQAEHLCTIGRESSIEPYWRVAVRKNPHYPPCSTSSDGTR